MSLIIQLLKHRIVTEGIHSRVPVDRIRTEGRVAEGHEGGGCGIVWERGCRKVFEFSSKNAGVYAFLLRKTTYGQKPRPGVV